MKITKYGISEAELRKAKANVGCDVCPRCGENKSDMDYVIESMESGKDVPIMFNKGILHLGYYTKYKGIFRTVIYHVDQYKCLSCNTEWESEPYEPYD